MIIDNFCPKYIIKKKYEIDVFACPEKTYKVVRAFDMGNSVFSRILFKLRGFPDGFTSFEGLQKFGFVILGEKKEKEIVFGLVGKFWTLSAGIQHLTAQHFKNFNQNGFAKVVANIALVPIAKDHTKVITETRVQCFGKLSTVLFKIYWTLIAPFSGLIRKNWLATIKRKSEKGMMSEG